MNTGLELSNSGESFSNFQFFGIGKPSAKQTKRREDLKEKIKNAGGLHTIVGQVMGKVGLGVPRSSALAGVRLNVFGLATRLYPAFLTETELKARHFDLENAKKAKEAWEKVKIAWGKLGGDRDGKKLKEAIIKGYDKPVWKHRKKIKDRQEKELNGFDGCEYSNYDGGAGAVAAYVSIGLGILGALVPLLTKAGAKKNPYADKEIDTTDMTPPTPEEIAKMVEEGLNDPNVDLSDGEEIMGISKPVFIAGATILSIATIFVAVKLYQKYK